MHEIDKEKFGAFLAQLRKEQGLTQKELAQRLFVSDKAVSKWERGLSLPDVALLVPLGEVLGMTISELLRGERAGQEALGTDEVNRLLTGAIQLSAQEQAARQEGRRRWRLRYFLCLGVVALELAVLLAMGGTVEGLFENLGVVEVLCLLFGAWFCLLARDTLPHFYDENEICFYGDGIFRMNLPGVHFNNSNWPHILGMCRGWMLGVAVVFPVLYWVLQYACPPGVWEQWMLAVQLTACLGFMLPTMVVGRRYQ